ncbi:MAG: PAS domain-containing protein [Sedimentisphaerales bacterium]|nr:PAS domain-containing protein [Sedimentisphaerales bacterium]
MMASFVDVTEAKQAQKTLHDSQSKYRTLLENLPQKIFLKDRDSVYVSCNENYARDIGIETDQIAGKTDYDFYPKELAEKYRSDDRRIIESTQTEDIEERYIQGGREVTVHTVKTPVKDQQGNVTGVLGIFWDITEQKRVEQALVESEAKYKTLVDSASEAIACIDGKGVFLFLNRTGAERLGGKSGDYIGKTMWDLFPKRIADEQMRNVRKVIRTGKGIRKAAITELQGHRCWRDTIVEPLRNSAGQVTASLVISRDIHNQKELEDKVEEYREEMLRVTQLAGLGTLSAAMAAELNQPLTAVRLSIQNALAKLETMNSPSPLTEDLRDAFTELSNAASMVERLRSLAWKSANRTAGKVPLGAVANRIVGLLQESAERVRMAIKVEGLDQLPAVYANERDLEWLFFSLVQNAIQASDGIRSRRLIISGVLNGEDIELRFADNCSGIDPENLGRLFEVFPTTPPPGDRCGLNLCAARRAVEQLGGKIRLDSKRDRSTFFVTLPIQPKR